MTDKRFIEEQIIQLLQEAGNGLSVSDVYRKHNRSERSFPLEGEVASMPVSL